MSQYALYTFTTPRTARYATYGNANTPAHLWVVCHGYGHLAERFIRFFEPLDPKRHLVVAPEGLSRFYIKGFSGKVGASWMTKAARKREIEDYVCYLDRLLGHIRNGINSSPRLHVLGFSQGAATASRWVGLGNCSADNLVLWSGLFPPDLDLEVHLPAFKKLKTWLVHGKQDKYREVMEVNKHEKRLQETGIMYEVCTFDGGHTIPKTLLLEIADRLEG